MEYVITTDRAFDQIEALTIDALEQQGLMVQRTFSLRSAMGAGGGNTDPVTAHQHGKAAGSSPGYSVLMLYAAGDPGRPLGLVTLYEQGGRTVINAVLTPLSYEQSSSPVTEDAVVDADAKLLASLVLSGLDFCVDVAAGQQCIDPRQVGDAVAHTGNLFQDPVCRKWIEPGQAEACIEFQGKAYHVCCSLCREEFERDPGHYVRAG
jgi:YHS domain-containing protein